MADVRRIANGLKDALDKEGVELTTVTCERAVVDLIVDGLIEPVKPKETEPPMVGQTTIDDHLERGSE